MHIPYLNLTLIPNPNPNPNLSPNLNPNPNPYPNPNGVHRVLCVMARSVQKIIILMLLEF